MDAELATLLAQDFATQKLRAEEKQHQLRTEIDTLKQELRTARKSILANTTTPTVDNIDLGQPKEPHDAAPTTSMPNLANTHPNITSAWHHLCLMYCHLTGWQQMGAWVVLVAGVLLPFLSASTPAQAPSSLVSLLFSLCRGLVFVAMALAGYQGLTVVLHARAQIVALEKIHTEATGKNLKLAERFTWSNRSKQQAQAYIFSSGRFLQSCHGVPRPVAEQLGQLIDLVVRDFIMNWYGGLTDDMTFINDGKVVTVKRGWCLTVRSMLMFLELFFLIPAVKLTLLNAVGELCHRIMGMNAVVRSLIAVSLPPSTVLIDLGVSLWSLCDVLSL
jgi:hypothetical protein